MHQWLARGEHELPGSREWLSPREWAYASTLRYTKRRTEFLLRRWTGKQAVASALGWSAAPADVARIEVSNRPSGAPYVLLDGAEVDFDISVSDRAGWAVCMVGANLSRVGIDLEIVEDRSSGFIADFLTPPEQEYVVTHDDPHAAANLLWSAKESALKVLRTGLRRDTRSVEVTVLDPDESGWGPLEVRSVEGALFPGWWRRDGVFLLTMTSDQPFAAPIALAGSADLAAAEPVHSWVHTPLAD